MFYSQICAKQELFVCLNVKLLCATYSEVNNIVHVQYWCLNITNVLMNIESLKRDIIRSMIN